jgi:hypothetical protein
VPGATLMELIRFDGALFFALTIVPFCVCARFVVSLLGKVEGKVLVAPSQFGIPFLILVVSRHLGNK